MTLIRSIGIARVQIAERVYAGGGYHWATERVYFGGENPSAIMLPIQKK